MKQDELEVIYALKEDEHKQIMLAWNPIVRRVFVIKRFAALARPQVYRQLSQCEEKGIVRIYAVEQEQEGFSVVEEYLDGELLSVWMKRLHAQPQIHEAFMQLLRIASALHRMSPPIIHRDLKPENFMCTARGIVLFDFDVSRPYARRQGASTVVGTLGYAAPEQLGFEHSDPRSDIYSLGVILNVLCCGHLPSIKQSHMYREVIRKCTRLDPQDRYQSVEELMDAFAPQQFTISRQKGIVLLAYALVSAILSFQAQPEQPAMMHEVILMRIALWLALLIPMALWALKDVILLRPPFSRFAFLQRKGQGKALILLGSVLIFAELFFFALLSVMLGALLA